MKLSWVPEADIFLKDVFAFWKRYFTGDALVKHKNKLEFQVFREWGRVRVLTAPPDPLAVTLERDFSMPPPPPPPPSNKRPAVLRYQSY